jgi:hypothetical protein
MAFNPDPGLLSQVQHMLTFAMAPDSASQAAALSALNAYSSSPDFLEYLSVAFCDTGAGRHLAHIAGATLSGFLGKGAGGSGGGGGGGGNGKAAGGAHGEAAAAAAAAPRRAAFRDLDAARAGRIKARVLGALASAEPAIASLAGGMVAALVRELGGVEAWPELSAALAGMLDAASGGGGGECASRRQRVRSLRGFVS